MAQVAFDTLKFVRTLEKSGVSSEQAEAISTAVKESHESAEIATKRDIDDLRKDLRLEMAEISSEQKVIRWMLGFVMAGILSLIIKAFF
ncbi:hypothetical phage protein [Candidatus Regiella insecticola]|uniref:Hypothetical phage protein n=2 Tax=Candidatus Regiella insecticola TaxID=138073 RepID=A0A6L2ZN42_9ENTR|nr:hypothetical phage protein [Candidatus Regiella insecticola]